MNDKMFGIIFGSMAPVTMGLGVYGLFTDNIIYGVFGFAGFATVLGVFLTLIEVNTRP